MDENGHNVSVSSSTSTYSTAEEDFNLDNDDEDMMTDPGPVKIQSVAQKHKVKTKLEPTEMENEKITNGEQDDEDITTKIDEALEAISPEKNISVTELQAIFDCFKFSEKELNPKILVSSSIYK